MRREERQDERVPRGTKRVHHRLIVRAKLEADAGEEPGARGGREAVRTGGGMPREGRGAATRQRTG